MPVDSFEENQNVTWNNVVTWSALTDRSNRGLQSDILEICRENTSFCANIILVCT